MDEDKRRQNERKFRSWEPFAQGGRHYWYEVTGRYGWKARYVKEAYADEKTLRFTQGIYDNTGELVEIHQKCPPDTRHRQVKTGRPS